MSPSELSWFSHLSGIGSTSSRSRLQYVVLWPEGGEMKVVGKGSFLSTITGCHTSSHLVTTLLVSREQGSDPKSMPTDYPCTLMILLERIRIHTHSLTPQSPLWSERPSSAPLLLFQDVSPELSGIRSQFPRNLFLLLPLQWHCF